MSRLHKLTAIVLSVFFCFYHVHCNTSVRQKTNISETNNTTHHRRHHADADLPHKLETAPIPAVHTGPQPEHLKIETRSAPIALENRYEPASKDEELERVNRHISSSNSPNPQRPTGWNGMTQQLDKALTGDVGTSYFHHPGHSQIRENHLSNTYNYYNLSRVYGSAYQYGSGQFKGYRESSNVGVIPPKNVNAKAYYNNISGLNNLPVIAQHSNELHQSLYGDRKNLNTYAYGYGGRDYVKNAYKNVLTGLAMWSILNGLTNGRRYTVYDHKSLPQNISTDITIVNNTITQCLDDVAILCGNHARPLCTENGTTYCVTSDVVPCPNEASGTSCVNVTVSCSGCDDVSYLQCAANLTVIYEDMEVGDNGVVLCVTSLMVPKTSEVVPCDKSSCSQKVEDSNMENTTKIV